MNERLASAHRIRQAEWLVSKTRPKTNMPGFA